MNKQTNEGLRKLLVNAFFEAVTKIETDKGIEISYQFEAMADVAIKLLSTQKMGVDGDGLAEEIKKFIVWSHNKSDWHYDNRENLWTLEGYKSRTTDKLYEYYKNVITKFQQPEPIK